MQQNDQLQPSRRFLCMNEYAEPDTIPVNHTPSAPPEVSADTKDLTAWDELPDATGHRAIKIPMEYDVNIAEELVKDGIDEADTELREEASSSHQT